jgi:hypothetical protein
MIARRFHRVSDASLTALNLFDLRQAFREGLLSRICRPPEMRSVFVPVRQSELRADLYLPGREGKHGEFLLVPGFTEFRAPCTPW